MCSIASDSISQGHLLQDEDSLLSQPDSYGGSDDKAELLRMLEEASSSSSSSSSEGEGEGEEEEGEEGDRDSDDEEEEISKWEVGTWGSGGPEINK